MGEEAVEVPWVPSLSSAPPGLKVVVAAETEQLLAMARAAIEALGPKLRNGRAVKAQAKRFARSVAADPLSLEIHVFDVVGFCTPSRDMPNSYEPLVIHDGKPKPVSFTHLMVGGEYWVCTSAEFNRKRSCIVASCARPLAEGTALSEAMFAAIDTADSNGTLTGSSCNASTTTVELYGDTGGAIAKQLPRWITVKGYGDDQDAT